MESRALLGQRVGTSFVIHQKPGFSIDCNINIKRNISLLANRMWSSVKPEGYFFLLLNPFQLPSTFSHIPLWMKISVELLCN